MERTLLDEILVSPNGTQFNIDGRQYFIDSADPLESLVLDENGDVKGVKLVDWQTGNTITWEIKEVPAPVAPKATDTTDPAAAAASLAQTDAANTRIEKETAIAHLLAYNILLQASKIRPASESDTTTLEKSEEKVTALSENIIEDTQEILTKDEALEKELQMSQTAGLSKEELRYQVELMKQDLEEIDGIIGMHRANAMEKASASNQKFTEKDFKSNPQIKELMSLRKRISDLLKRKISALHGIRYNKIWIKTKQPLSLYVLKMMTIHSITIMPWF